MSVAYLDAATAEAGFPALMQNRSKFEKTIYYRAPAQRSDGKGGLFTHAQAGWITCRGNNDNTQLTMLRKGYQPLPQFGIVAQGTPQNPSAYDRYGKWGPILTHPDGPAQFPLAQILALGWYRPERVPVPGVKFPALSKANLERELGEARIVEFHCPECERYRTLKANHLGRHLKVSHDYDRTELMALARDKGWSFSKDLTGDRIEQAFEFTDDEPEDAPAAPVAEPSFEVAVDRPRATRRSA